MTLTCLNDAAPYTRNQRSLKMTSLALLGDCLQVLKLYPENHFDSIVTDPPYGLSFMGRKWDYDVPSVEVWAECLRVLKPGGHLLAFAGTRTQHRMACRIEDGGFEIRDMLAWLYGSGFPKSHNGEWGGTALKPALEPITMARKPLMGTVESNWREHGTGALNIDGCRVGTESTLRTKAGGSNQFPHEDDAWQPKTVQVGSDAGRWPANLIHDGSPEVVALFPGEGDKSAARFFYCAKANKYDRDEGLDGFEVKHTGGMQATADGSMLTGGGNERTTRRANTHPTVKPTDLMRYLCRLVTPPGGVVLDPFMGSGSTGKAAMLEGFDFVGIERDPEYFKIAEARCA
jgi:site-specific DNA-methyltransferase (adenine-specific)